MLTPCTFQAYVGLWTLGCTSTRLGLFNAAFAFVLCCGAVDFTMCNVLSNAIWFADDLDPFDVLWPVQQLHQQANKSLHNLLQYRFGHFHHHCVVLCWWFLNFLIFHFTKWCATSPKSSSIHSNLLRPARIEIQHRMFIKSLKQYYQPWWPRRTDYLLMFFFRRMWDRYLHEKGTRISVGWVEPVEPASEEWAKYLTGQTTSVQDSASSKDTKTWYPFASWRRLWSLHQRRHGLRRHCVTSRDSSYEMVQGPEAHEWQTFQEPYPK